MKAAIYPWVSTADQKAEILKESAQRQGWESLYIHDDTISDAPARRARL